MHRFEWAAFVPVPVSSVWEFFSNPRNLALLTPPEMRLAVAAAPAQAATGAEVDIRVRVLGVPLRWRSRIEACEPGRYFVDRQVRGPYRHWRHEHRFEAAAGGTWIRDVVEYSLPFGRLGDVVGGSWVRRVLARMFHFRGLAAVRQLGPPRPRAAVQVARCR